MSGHMKGDGGSTPHQYSIPSDAKELQDLIEYRNMNFAVGNIFKACYRMGRKEGADELYDLNKIIFFAEREKKRIKREEAQCGCGRRICDALCQCTRRSDGIVKRGGR